MDEGNNQCLVRMPAMAFAVCGLYVVGSTILTIARIETDLSLHDIYLLFGNALMVVLVAAFYRWPPSVSADSEGLRLGLGPALRTTLTLSWVAVREVQVRRIAFVHVVWVVPENMEAAVEQLPTWGRRGFHRRGRIGVLLGYTGMRTDQIASLITAQSDYRCPVTIQ